MTDNQPTPEQYAKLTDLTIEALRQTLQTMRKLQNVTSPTYRARLVEEARFYLRVLEHTTAPAESEHGSAVLKNGDIVIDGTGLNADDFRALDSYANALRDYSDGDQS